jgi:hypothetical protein
MTITQVLQEVHKKYEGGSTDYPESTSEDFTLRNSFADDGIEAWESEVHDGTQWAELVEEHLAAANGTGVDDLPEDWLAPLRVRDEDGEHPAELKAGSTVYTEVTPAKGERMKRDGNANNVFWIAGGKIHTYPAMSGNFTLPYLRTATRYPLGTESTPIEMSRPKFLVYYILSQIYLKDRNAMGFQANQQLAIDEMRKMKIQNNQEYPSESGFGFGM